MEPTHQPLFARKNVVYLSAAFCCLLWGSAYPAIKSGYEIFQIATDDIPSKIVFAGYRFLFAGLLLLLLAVVQRKPIGRLSNANLAAIHLLLHWPGVHDGSERVHHECDRDLLQRAAGPFYLP